MKSQAVIDRIMKLKSDGYPIKKIAAILGVSRNTVRRYLREPLPIPLVAMKQPVHLASWQLNIDWERICKERQQGYSVKALYDEYNPDISYPRFCACLRQSVGKVQEIAVRLEHKPGEKTQVDFCDGISIYDRRSGKARKTHLFVGTLPFSSYCFGLFVENQKLPTFIRAHEAMWAFFGGVTPYVVIDNLRSGVSKAHRYDPEINPTYCDFGDHCKFAALPARPYTPRDKACVEANIGAIQRGFFQTARRKKYYSLRELNQDFRQYLREFNERVMADHGVSRSERFMVEREKLLALPEKPFEIYDFREAKVHPDCCIQVDKSFYSVPHNYRGQVVRVKLSDTQVTVFDKDIRQIACHRRSQRIGAAITVNEHYPDSILQTQSYCIQQALIDAEKIGPKTHELVQTLVHDDRPLRYLRRVQGILRLQNNLQQDAIEFGCSQALTYKRYQLAFIKSCAQQHAVTRGNLTICRPERDANHIYLRGGYDV